MLPAWLADRSAERVLLLLAAHPALSQLPWLLPALLPLLLHAKQGARLPSRHGGLLLGPSGRRQRLVGQPLHQLICWQVAI